MAHGLVDCIPRVFEELIVDPSVVKTEGCDPALAIPTTRLMDEERRTLLQTAAWSGKSQPETLRHENAPH